MSRRAWACAFALVAACGGAPAPVASSDDAVSRLNLPDTAWQRIDVPEGGFTVEVPGEAQRQVATSDTSQTFQYLIDRTPIAVVIGVEHLAVLATPEHAGAALDAVAAETARRTESGSRSCRTRPIESVQVGGVEARRVTGTDCTGEALAGGAMVTTSFLYGRAVVVLVVLGAGLDVGTMTALSNRMVDSVALGEAPSWFMPIDTEVRPTIVPGLSFMLPAGVETHVVEREGGAEGRYTAEPIRGMALVAIVNVPAAQSAAQYCDALVGGGHLELAQRTDRTSADGTYYCEVRGRNVATPELTEISHVMVIGGGVLQLTWVGPTAPSFVPQGEVQLARVHDSVRYAQP